MPTVSKFYLHDATTAVAGTLPGSATLSATTSSVTVTGSGTNRTMDGTAGVAQTSQSWTTLANQTAQPTFVRRFLSEPLGINAFGSGSLLAATLVCGSLQSNSNSRLTPALKIWVWRPSSGAIIATLGDSDTNGLGVPTSTAEVWNRDTDNPFSGSGSSADGDVLVLELWRSSITQTHSTGYTNTLYYDGTADPPSFTFAPGSNTTTSDAAALLFFHSGDAVPQPVEMSAGAPPPRVPYRNPMPPLIAQ